MKKLSMVVQSYLNVVLGMLILLALYLARMENFLLFHAIVEMFTIAVAFGLFMLAWNSRRFVDNGYLLWIGIAYLAISFLDLAHTLAYRGMNVIPGTGTNPATQLWIAGRLVQGLSLVIAPLAAQRKFKPGLVVLGYVVVCAGLLLTVLVWPVFPACYDETLGRLTPFKIGAEYAVIGLLLIGFVLLLRIRDRFSPEVMWLIAGSIAVTMASELAFTLYSDPYGVANLIGHYLKLASYYLIYKALVETGMRRPHEVLFHNLKRSEEELRTLNETLEQRVVERTAAAERSTFQARTLATELTHAEERERRRLAEILHDNFQQMLAAAKLQVGIVKKRSTQTELAETLGRIDEMLDETIRMSRTLAVDASPPVLHRGSLVDSIRWLGEQMKENHGLCVDVIVAEKVDPLAETVRFLLFRAVKELLFNSAKHGKVESATVRMKRSPDGSLEIIVEDSGVGFDLSVLEAGDGRGAGFGLVSVRGRIELLGGSLTVESTPGRGCRSTITIPMEQAARTAFGGTGA